MCSHSHTIEHLSLSFSQIRMRWSCHWGSPAASVLLALLERKCLALQTGKYSQTSEFTSLSPSASRTGEGKPFLHTGRWSLQAWVS